MNAVVRSLENKKKVIGKRPGQQYVKQVSFTNRLHGYYAPRVKRNLFRVKVATPLKPVGAYENVMESFNAIVDAVTEDSIFLTVRSAGGTPVEFAIARKGQSSSIEEGDFCIIEYFVRDGRLRHRLRKVCEPRLPEELERKIDSSVEKIFAGQDL